MKNIKYLSFSLIITIFFVSCSTNSSDTNEVQKETESLYHSKTSSNYPINLHNASLAAFIIDADVNHSEYISSDNPSEKMLDFIEDYMKVNMEMEGIDEEWITTFYENFRNFDSQSNSQYVEITNGYYYNRIMDILDNGSSYSVVNQELDNLLISLDEDGNISDSDKSILRYGIAIGKESYEYWENNNSKWSEVGINYYEENGLQSKKDRGAIAQADVESAIGGAITGAFTGGPFGALVGATLGAAWGSAISGAAQHFGWDWSWE